MPWRNNCMSELNRELLKSNIRIILEERGVTQAELAEITGMSQPNVSKALNPKDKKCFTVEQLFAIAQHFGVSLDELTGNRLAENASTNPRAVLSFLTELYQHRHIRFQKVTEEELIYDQYYNSHGYPDCDRKKRNIEYLAFYFPNYMRPSEYAVCDEEYMDIDAEFCACGNDTKFKHLNLILPDFLPIIKLHREKQIADKPFQLILEDYLNQLSNK